MSSSTRENIVVSGSIAQDTIYLLPGHFVDMLKFQDQHKISVSILSNEHHRYWGGTGANIAYTLALLGEKPRLLGSIGRGDTQYLDKLKALGVNVDQVHKSTSETAAFTVFTDIENNQVAAFSGGAMFDPESFVMASLISALPDSFAIISPNDPQLMEMEIAECKKTGTRMCFDVGQQVINGSEELLRSGIETCEVLIANDYEIEKICERLDVVKEALFETIPVCITTLGSKGSRIQGNCVLKPIDIPVALTKQVVDPTGAGDAYRAGFFYGYVRGWNLEICGNMGSVAASFAIECFGGQEHSFTREEFVRRYEDGFQKKLKL